MRSNVANKNQCITGNLTSQESNYKVLIDKKPPLGHGELKGG